MADDRGPGCSDTVPTTNPVTASAALAGHQNGIILIHGVGLSGREKIPVDHVAAQKIRPEPLDMLHRTQT
jgi:hypothetical protein